MTMETTRHPYSELTPEGRTANLQYRCNVANRVQGKSIFISIHANAFDNPSVSGYEIFVSHRSSERFEIAKHIHQASKLLGVKDRGIKEGNFYVLNNTKMPAILIEHEFYTNLAAVQKLKDNDFRNKCAEHIKLGLLNYLRALE